jgi:hypothetical protein
MNESQFQKKLIDEIKSRFPGSIVLKTDANAIQGFPDLLILWNTHWAALECKRDASASMRPNQEYYIHLLNEMSFASVIFPEVKDEVLDAMERSL